MALSGEGDLGLDEIDFPAYRHIDSQTERHSRNPLTIRANELEAELVHLLKEIPYSDYLATAHWRWVKKLAVEHYGARCCFCGSEQRLEVHHRKGPTYNAYHVKGSETLIDLAVFCRECHGHLHEKAA